MLVENFFYVSVKGFNLLEFSFYVHLRSNRVALRKPIFIDNE